MSDHTQDQATAPQAQAGVNPRKLFVGNLSWNLTSEDLQQLFAEFGTVEEAFVLTDKFSGRSKGFGFVTMSTDEEAQAAVAGLHQREVDGRQIAVNVAQPPKPRNEWQPRGDRGGDRGGRGGFGGGRRDNFRRDNRDR
ncbi:RNA-binding protein [Patescibacteria group bacterium]|nr:RNA-binding protein [Patescibacteria group bacterium]